MAFSYENIILIKKFFKHVADFILFTGEKVF